MTKTIQTTCPYCGVGCGINAKVDTTQHRLVIWGDKQHPANFGRLCSKGSALGDTIELNTRLLQPRVNGHETSWTVALDLVADTFMNIVKQHGANAVAFYGSGQLLTEDYYVANKLMKGFIGGGNMDTNSRLCMSSSVAGHKRAFGADVVPNCYEDYEHAKLIVLIGSNAAWCHPVSFQRIRAAKEANSEVKIVVIDPRRTASCDIADLHLPLKSGSDAWLFNGLLSYLSEHQALDHHYIEQHTEGFHNPQLSVEEVARQCQLNLDDVQRFYDWFAHTDKTLSLYSQGINQSTSGTDKVNAILNCHLATGRIGKLGCGALSLTGQPNAMGGREVGGLAHQLAAHIDFSNTDDIERVARFWQAPNIAKRGGLPAVELFDAIFDGNVKAIWIFGTNPVVSLPNADKVKLALQRCEFVVVSDCVANTDTTAFAHVLLPASAWSEKDGTVTNSERRISRQRALFPAAGNAKPDWWILTQVAKRMGFSSTFNYQSPVEIFREHAALSGFENNRQRAFDISGLANISLEDYDNLQPIQWGINSEHPNGKARFFADGKFFTASGKAQFINVTPRSPAHAPDADYPLILNTGRLRDQWHTMTRTALAAKLNQHRPESLVEIHPDDAEQYSLVVGGLAQLESRWGTMLARVQTTDEQTRGNVFVPMHWTDQYASNGRVGALVNPVIDPISKQPESKHTPIRIRAYTTGYYGFVLTRLELDISNLAYWVKTNGEGYYRYELADDELASNLLRTAYPTADWQEYKDDAKAIYRAAAFSGQRLEAVICIAPDSQLPERSWLSSLFAKSELEANERKALLTGKPPAGQADVGRIMCACFNVGEKTIRAAIKEQGLTTYQQIGQCLKAGTNCGSCVPEIKALL
jgi:assimilatory nitrate reductase catalytic subunit